MHEQMRNSTTKKKSLRGERLNRNSTAKNTMTGLKSYVESICMLYI